VALPPPQVALPPPQVALPPSSRPWSISATGRRVGGMLEGMITRWPLWIWRHSRRKTATCRYSLQADGFKSTSAIGSQAQRGNRAGL
jgi:hypothetical protein